MATFNIFDRERKQNIEIELTLKELDLFFGSDEDWFKMCDLVEKRTGIKILGNDLISLDGRPVH